MSRKKDTSGLDEALEEIESLGDRLVNWVSDHRWWVLGGAAAVVALAGGLGSYRNWQATELRRASATFEAVRSQYFIEMGAQPEAIEIPELANPEAAKAIRADYRGRFREVAEELAGTVPGSLAWLEAGQIAELEGDTEAALAAWQNALENLPPDSRLRGLVLQRVGQHHEAAGSWLEAAQSHEAAGEIEAYPLRFRALADAGRCFDQARQSVRALELLERVADADEAALPDHLRTRLRELRATTPVSAPPS